MLCSPQSSSQAWQLGAGGTSMSCKRPMLTRQGCNIITTSSQSTSRMCSQAPLTGLWQHKHNTHMTTAPLGMVTPPTLRSCAASLYRIQWESGICLFLYRGKTAQRCSKQQGVSSSVPACKLFARFELYMARQLQNNKKTRGFQQQYNWGKHFTKGIGKERIARQRMSKHTWQIQCLWQEIAAWTHW